VATPDRWAFGARRHDATAAGFGTELRILAGLDHLAAFNTVEAILPLALEQLERRHRRPRPSELTARNPGHTTAITRPGALHAAALAVSSPAAQNVARQVALTTSWSPERIGRFTAVNCDDIEAADLRAPRLLDEEVADRAFGAANRNDGGGDEPA
jgi:hypothetical protein